MRKLLGRQGLNTKTSSLIKKTLLTTIVGVGLTFNVAYASESELDTIYHVYMDGEHIGKVDSKEVIDQYIDQRINNLTQSNQEYSYTFEEEISYVSETVFNPVASNEKVLNLLEEELTVQVNAFELKVGNNVVGYFKDQTTAEDTIKQLKLKYVDKEILEALEQPQSGDENALALGDSKVIDVQLSEKVSVSSKKVSEDQLLTKENGLKLLEKGTLEDKKHIVDEGEVLGSIADKYNLTLKKLMELNPKLNEDSLIQIGQEVNVTEYKPFVNVVVKKEELVEETIKHEKEVVSSDELYKGDTKVKQEGQDGAKEVHYALETVNGKTVNKEVLKETVTEEPVKEIVIKGTKVVPSRGSGDLQWPAVGGFVTSHMGSRWGSYHKGIDIAGVSNRSILAADNGTVVSAGWDNGGYGNKVIIDHNNGYRTVYAHLSSISVNAGQTVEKGSKIGVMGTTGNSTGVHLHFELYKDGSLVNPEGSF
ncbi:peptidoglycan DD-metalloendopeptidase family protein [Aquibacillus kalidii]|uniref:peptidoglycan DD-metalloendopeptidase family protein n=1 Tax=Aquibacillus kalidii TaxID=2762597 RepID=UPI001647D976|nr:M23 family metallopeptidase [Aquibacillus kalidii]